MAQAETKYYRSVIFNSKVAGCDWSGWKDSNIRITIDYFRRHIEILSETPQVIDYAALSETKTDAYMFYYGSGTDRYYKPIGIGFQVFTYGTFYLTIQYSDCTYSYSLIETDPD
jgi:hypothetical protein